MRNSQEGETVFGWNWEVIFWVTTLSGVVGTTLKVIRAKPFDTPPCPDSGNSAKIAGF